jgi:hypothetical protein
MLALKGLGLKCNEDDIRKLVKEADKDMSGTIDFEEFNLISDKFSHTIEKHIRHLDSHKTVIEKREKSKSNPDRGLVRYEFISCIVMLSLARYFNDGSGAGGTKDQPANKDLCKNKPEAVERFFKTNFAQAVEAKEREAKGHAVSLRRNEFRANFVMKGGPSYLGHKLLRGLKHLYMFYTCSDDKSPELATKFNMKFRHYRDLLKQSGLMDCMCHQDSHTNELHHSNREQSKDRHSGGDKHGALKTKPFLEDDGKDSRRGAEKMHMTEGTDFGMEDNCNTRTDATENDRIDSTRGTGDTSDDQSCESMDRVNTNSSLDRAIIMGRLRVGGSGPNGRFSEKTIRLAFNQSRMLQVNPLHHKASPAFDEITFEDFIECFYRIAAIAAHEDDPRGLVIKAHELWVDFFKPLLKFLVSSRGQVALSGNVTVRSIGRGS